jgi:hypothetical protein
MSPQQPSSSKSELEILRVLKTFYDVQKLRLATELRVKVTRFSVCANNHMVPMAVARDRCPICDAPVTEVVVEASRGIKGCA